jgi:hypothetical protein
MFPSPSIKLIRIIKSNYEIKTCRIKSRETTEEKITWVENVACIENFDGES